MELVPPAVASPPFVASEPLRAALYMVELFSSIGASHFDVTFTHLSGDKRGFRAKQTTNQLCTSLPYLVRSNRQHQTNVIVRPRVEGATCIQLDDLDAAKAAKIAPAAFLTLETSPGNFQSWVAVSDAPMGTTARLRRGIGADLNASGATRVAGTLNFKPKYAPAFPMVQTVADQLGHVATMAELEALHVMAAPVAAVQIDQTATRSRRPARTWPSYEKCLSGAPSGQHDGPQRTRADFVWCKIAQSWGHSADATARELMRVSTKAQENGAAYALKTATASTKSAAEYNATKAPHP